MSFYKKEFFKIFQNVINVGPIISPYCKGKSPKSINVEPMFIPYYSVEYPLSMCKELFPTFCSALRTIISKLKENIVGSKNVFNCMIIYFLLSGLMNRTSIDNEIYDDPNIMLNSRVPRRSVKQKWTYLRSDYYVHRAGSTVADPFR